MLIAWNIPLVLLFVLVAMIGMGLNFRPDVVAEGVETEVQLDFLKQSGCVAR